LADATNAGWETSPGAPFTHVQENCLTAWAHRKALLEHFKDAAADPKPWFSRTWNGKEE